MTKPTRRNADETVAYAGNEHRWWPQFTKGVPFV